MTIGEFIEQHKASGQHFFDRDSMKFFDSKLVRRSWNGDGYFITSEQCHHSNSTSDPRKWTIRKGDLTTFDVRTVGAFQAYSDEQAAFIALRVERAKVSRTVDEEAVCLS